MKYKMAGAKSPLRFADIIGPAKAVPLLQSAWQLRPNEFRDFS
jgi:hypothetical protein